MHLRGMDPFTLSNGNPGGGRELAKTRRRRIHAGHALRHARGDVPPAPSWSDARAVRFETNQNEARLGVSPRSTPAPATRARVRSRRGENPLKRAYDKRVYFFGQRGPDYIETVQSPRDPRRSSDRRVSIQPARGFRRVLAPRRYSGVVSKFLAVVRWPKYSDGHRCPVPAQKRGELVVTRRARRACAADAG